MVTPLGLVSRVALVSDAIQVVVRLRHVERWRSLGPRTAASLAREMGRGAPVRSPRGRVRLRRAIGLVDGLFGPNCYRRVLLEVALDGDAVEDPIYFGIRGRGDGGLGHAWRGQDAALESQYEAVFRVA